MIKLFLLALLVSGHIIQASVVESTQQNTNDYFIYQNGTEKKLPVYNGVIPLSREPFSIRFYNKEYNWNTKHPYATKISVLINKDKWLEVNSGEKAEDSPFFYGGSAFAITPEHRYNALFFSDTDDTYLGGSHNIRYGHTEENRTADVLDKQGEYFKLEFKVDTLFMDSKMINIEESGIPRLYFIIFNDKNLDEIIDEDELMKFIVHLGGCPRTKN